MHKEFKRLLGSATGKSEHVIVVNLDIRGFSSFCKNVDSLDVATFITMVYSKILDEYFKNASYYKPTGDGLIIIIPYVNDNLKERVNSILEMCVNIVDNFSSFFVNEGMINFPTPIKVGIGIARGSACCIIDLKEDKVLDYSGSILNLASRLMDMARPSGVVFDCSLGLNLIEEKIKQKFKKEMVYVRGVAETKPRIVYYSKDHTIIPNQFKVAIREPIWKTQKVVKTIKQIKMPKIGKYMILLKEKPLDTEQVTLRLSFNDPTNSVSWVGWNFSLKDKMLELLHITGNYELLIDVMIMMAHLDALNLPEDTELNFETTYPVKE